MKRLKEIREQLQLDLLKIDAKLELLEELEREDNKELVERLDRIKRAQRNRAVRSRINA